MSGIPNRPLNPYEEEYYEKIAKNYLAHVKGTSGFPGFFGRFFPYHMMALFLGWIIGAWLVIKFFVWLFTEFS